MMLTLKFFNCKQAHQTANHCTQVTFSSQNFDFYACLSQNVVKRDASGRKARCHVADTFLTRLKLIWPISSMKISKMSKKAFLGKSSRSQWVNIYEPISDCTWNSPGIVHILISSRYLFLQHQLKLQSTADIHDLSTADVFSPNLTWQVQLRFFIANREFKKILRRRPRQRQWKNETESETSR